MTLRRLIKVMICELYTVYIVIAQLFTIFWIGFIVYLTCRRIIG